MATKQRNVGHAKQVVASHFSIGAQPSLLDAPVERVVAAGYDILHGAVLTREQRISLLEALAVLEWAGNYQPRM